MSAIFEGIGVIVVAAFVVWVVIELIDAALAWIEGS